MNIYEGKERLKETAEKFGEQLSEGEQIQLEGEESDRIAASIDTIGLDNETIEATHQVESDLSHAYTERITAVEELVEQTAENVQENVDSLGENKALVERNAEKYSEMAGVSEIGRVAADAGRSKMEGDSQEYGNLIQENTIQMERSRERAKNMSSVISGLFRRR